jgi:hypothetical protein
VGKRSSLPEKDQNQSESKNSCRVTRRSREGKEIVEMMVRVRIRVRVRS